MFTSIHKLLAGSLVVMVIMSMLSQTVFAASPDLESLRAQLQTLQERLQTLQSSATRSTGSDFQTSLGCFNKQQRFENGAVSSTLTLNNGFTSSLRGFQYRCTNGRWVLERVTEQSSNRSGQGAATSNRSATTTSSTGCLSGSQRFSEGDRRSTITENGVTRTVADASFVCRSGRWQIEGSLPNRPNSSGSVASSTAGIGKGCQVGTRAYTHGQVIPKILTLPGINSDRITDNIATMPLLERVICNDGRWVDVGQSGKRECLLSNGRKVDHGVTSAIPALPGVNPVASRRATQYVCIDGKWSDAIKQCLLDGSQIAEGERVTIATTTTALGTSNGKNQRVTFTCRNGQLVR